MSQKHSRQIWLHDVKSEWPIKRIKYTTYLKARVGWHGLTSSEYLNEGILLVTGTDFQNGRIIWENCYRVSEERYEQDQYIQIREGDLLITKDGTIGKVAVVEGLNEPATLNSGVFVTRPLKKAYSNRFMYWILQSQIFQSFIDYIKVGTTINHLYQNQLSDFAFPVPSLEIQEAIASFLDRKTAAISTLIAKKQRLIQLLAEKRTALIKQVVSRGLNPNAPMKDSGIPWVGKIPKHWGVVRIGYFAQIGNGSTPRRDHAEYWSSEDFPWLNSSKINDEIIQHPDQYVSKQALKECHLPIVPAESVLVAITGEGQTRGRSALLKFAATINQHLAYIKVIDDRLDNEYLRRQLQAAYQWLRSESNGAGSTRAALTCEFLAEMKVLIPPLNEQKKIVHLIDEQIKVIDLLIEKLRLSLMYLEEYRQSLITAAVTGKINVKEGITA